MKRDSCWNGFHDWQFVEIGQEQNFYFTDGTKEYGTNDKYVCQNCGKQSFFRISLKSEITAPPKLNRENVRVLFKKNGQWLKEPPRENDTNITVIMHVTAFYSSGSVLDTPTMQYFKAMVDVAVFNDSVIDVLIGDLARSMRNDGVNGLAQIVK